MPTEFSVAAPLEASVSMIETTLLVVLKNMDGERWCTSTKQLQETLLQVCERRMPGELRNSVAATLQFV